MGEGFRSDPELLGMVVESRGLQVMQSGERTNTEGKSVSNRILLAVSDSDYSSLRPHLEYLSLPKHLGLHEGVEGGICVFRESRFDFTRSRNEGRKDRGNRHSRQ